MRLSALLTALAALMLLSIPPPALAQLPEAAIALDAVEFVRGSADPIDLLYLDADGAPGQGKAVYLDILRAGYDRLPAGSVVLAHNSVNAAERLAEYLQFVRDDAHFHASVNVILDGEGLEVSVR